MNPHFKRIILETTSATELYKTESIQSLWSGYGEIVRYKLIGSKLSSIVVKHVQLPDQQSHPRGWNTDLSHQRKITSYQAESAFYHDYAFLCNDQCRVPECYSLEANENQFLIVLEDLDAQGFSKRINKASTEQMKSCLSWLAHFHASFMDRKNQIKTEGLWPIGTYWHLDTRPDELQALDDLPLKNAAQKIDQLLNDCPFQTLVHGDAKLANFCFSENENKVAAVDFQYVGSGCGIKDVAYFIGSCLPGEDCKTFETELLDYYFDELHHALNQTKNQKQPDVYPSLIEQAWRPLYDVAWADFHRFVKGWSPGHWKIHDYSERLAQRVIARISSEN